MTGNAEPLKSRCSNLSCNLPSTHEGDSLFIGARLLDAEVVARQAAADARLGERVAAVRGLADQRALHRQRALPLQRRVPAGAEQSPHSAQSTLFSKGHQCSKAFAGHLHSCTALGVVHVMFPACGVFKVH